MVSVIVRPTWLLPSITNQMPTRVLTSSPLSSLFHWFLFLLSPPMHLLHLYDIRSLKSFAPDVSFVPRSLPCSLPSSSTFLSSPMENVSSSCVGAGLVAFILMFCQRDTARVIWEGEPQLRKWLYQWPVGKFARNFLE